MIIQISEAEITAGILKGSEIRELIMVPLYFFYFFYIFFNINSVC